MPGTNRKNYSGTLVLVAENLRRDGQVEPLFDRQAEMLDDGYTNYLIELLGAVADHVVLCDDLENLPSIFESYSEIVVLPLWSGAISRNRMAHAPMLCESLGIPYVGADGYAKFLCQDKFLAKRFARSVGLRVAEDVLIRASDEMSALDALGFPLVVKPVSEGTSIGVRLFDEASQREDMREYVQYALQYFDQPVLAEKFLPGREVMICVCGSEKNPFVLGATEIYVEEQAGYFDSKIFTADLKKDRLGKTYFKTRDITDEIAPFVFEKIRHAYSLLGKTDFVRFDGRIHNNDFTLIELSPLPFFGHWGSLATLLKRHDLTIPDFIGDQIVLALTTQGRPLEPPMV